MAWPERDFKFISKHYREMYFDNMRTEYAWYVALDSTHHWVGNLPSMEDKMYDLGIIINFCIFS